MLDKINNDESSIGVVNYLWNNFYFVPIDIGGNVYSRANDILNNDISSIEVENLTTVRTTISEIGGKIIY